jgi:hypothetical protein
MLKKISTQLHSPYGYIYKCVFMYNYIVINGTEKSINGTFYIGNPKTKPDEACITISVFYPSSDLFVSESIASFILIKYYETCSENQHLPSGNGTVDMVITAMSFVKQMCSFVKEFKLNDSSVKKCSNGKNITLPYFYITQKYMTWYEGKFGATLQEPVYSIYRDKVSQVMNTILPEFHIFEMNHIKNTNTPKSVIDALKTVYKPGNTLKDFFNVLYSTYDVSMGCILLQPWIDTLMNNTGLHSYITMHDWYISVSKIPTYKFIPKNSYKINTYNSRQKRNPWNNI